MALMIEFSQEQVLAAQCCEALSLALYKDVLMRQDVQKLIRQLGKHHGDSALHSMRVGQRCHRIGVYNQYAAHDCETLAMAGLLHDIGKLGIPLSVLDNDRELTEEEHWIVRQHPRLAFIALASLEYEDVRRVLVSHHECKEDVTKNYPRSGVDRRDSIRLQKDRRARDEKIDRFVKLLAAVDICDALVNKRSYKDALNLEEAERIMRREFGKDHTFVDQALLFEHVARLG